MPELQAQRRLVKSPPELWAEVSDAASLARHLGEVGEITITRVEPESTVAWEGERASGTVQLEPAGWGTRVTLTAQPSAGAPEPVAAPEPAPATEEQPPPAVQPARDSFLRRLLRRRAAPTPEPAPAPESPTPVAAEPEPAAAPEPAGDGLQAALTAALDSLGAAHHRPFSRG
jgi:hypothetical protein